MKCPDNALELSRQHQCEVSGGMDAVVRLKEILANIQRLKEQRENPGQSAIDAIDLSFGNGKKSGFIKPL
ncbi:MAG: hypothetical protein LBR25_04110 [Erysipelotrichaceae bacterium]|jgi:formate hydrogenlyase subunit 6/NADH:ubiquinone oxidoreductase subunit I|nr:hypothetical protein [Erysipelotrichaceae bacterium]